jgi:hypothetical protein
MLSLSARQLTVSHVSSEAFRKPTRAIIHVNVVDLLLGYSLLPFLGDERGASQAAKASYKLQL